MDRVNTMTKSNVKDIIKFFMLLIFSIALIGLLSFFALDSILGESEYTTVNVTVTDKYRNCVRSGKTNIIKYYIVVDTEDGEQTFTVNVNLYNDIEINNEVEVTKTVTHTKWTDNTLINYSID